MARNADMLEGSPPYMHTRYLSEAEQVHCLKNPTYSGRLASLKALRQEVQYAQIAFDVGRRTGMTAKRQIAAHQQALYELEGRFTAEDNVLATLAEALLRSPVFWHTEQVRLVDGEWVWPLPQLQPLLRVDRMAAVPDHLIPRHDTAETTFARRSGPTPARRLSQRFSNGLSKLLPGRSNSSAKRLPKVRSVEWF